METSLPADTDCDDININGYQGRFLNIGNGKGLATFTRNHVICEHRQDVGKETLQISKISIEGIDSISVYRSNSHSILEVREALTSMIDVGKPTLITGDFNLCSKKSANNIITVSLTKIGFQMLIDRPTHIQGGHIDHIYWMDKDGRFKLPTVEFYSPYWTDHDSLLVTITERYQTLFYS